MNHQRLRVAFRSVAVLEALTWVGLLIGMFFKYVVDAGDLGVRIFGPIHGAVFIAFVILVIVCAVAFRWRPLTLVLGLASSIIPFATVVFDVWAERTGRLSRPAATNPAT